MNPVPVDFGSPGESPEPSDGSSVSSSTWIWVGILGVVAIVGLLNGDKLRHWFWTTERTKTKCMSRASAMVQEDRYTKANGWERVEYDITHPRYEKNQVCFRKNVGSLSDNVDERFVPESVKREEQKSKENW